MSLQDDIFDVMAALKRKPEAKAFDRLMQHLDTVEQEADTSKDLLNRLGVGLGALADLKKWVP